MLIFLLKQNVKVPDHFFFAKKWQFLRTHLSCHCWHVQLCDMSVGNLIKTEPR